MELFFFFCIRKVQEKLSRDLAKFLKVILFSLCCCWCFFFFFEGEDRIKREIRFSTYGIGEGNGNPLQYSCLENPTDRGTWWATVNRVSKSQTWLSMRHSPLVFGVVVEIPWIGSIPGLRLSSQNLPTSLPKCMLSVYATVVHLVT